MKFKREKKFKKEDFVIPKGSGTGFPNSAAMARAMGMDLEKRFIFPDGAGISFFNINEKNIRLILKKYEQYIQPESVITNADITYNVRRRGLVYSDDEATLVIGYVDTEGIDCPYKIYEAKDKKVFATFLFQRPEEVFLTKFKKIVRFYDDCHRLIRMNETFDNQLKVYKVDPETHGISCEIYDLTKKTNADIEYD